ncbi:MAG: sugar ABC transporter substrate-binding protein [Candidatus Sumerlaeaceae bacterium]|nr:sugar ABC transporter substrate-binding protein [Candidatus Sumerlaeaceae bacterium]
MKHEISMRRILISLIVTLTCCAAFGADKKVVKFLAAQYSTATEPYWKELESAFEKENPDIDLQIEVFYWKGLHDKITTLIGAKEQPDLANIGTSWLPEYVKAGIAQTIDDRLTSGMKARFVENLLAGAAMDGKTYGLPIATSVRALYYNKALFEEAKLEAPKNWDEFKAAAKKLTKPGKVYGTAMPIHQDDQGDQFTYFLFGAGGDWFDAKGNVTLNSPEAVEALQFMVDLYKARVTNPEPWTNNRDETQKLFINGRAGMIMTGNFLVPILAKENDKLQYGVAPIPANKKPGTLAITDTMVFFNRDKQDKDAVWKFVDFMYRTEWRQKFLEAEGMLPELSDLAKKRESDPKTGVFIKLLPTAKFQPNHADFVPISQRVVKAVQLALLGEATPKEALDKAVEEINTTILHKK